ncbi:cellulase family glycosylhydrolase [Microbulbifer sp. MCCC 1A16149]|uniref:cellulase family glycosylhydrolase n=1 Tax=Microbulbifer sp. MCCC 1A16149 TaxID=3411322 RepID=UPI003D133C4A
MAVVRYSAGDSGEEDFVIISIANEPFGNNVAESTYVNDTKSAIQALRNGGLQYTLMIGAGNWGQSWQNFMRNNMALAIWAGPGPAMVAVVRIWILH